MKEQRVERSYIEDLRLTKSLLVVTRLQKRPDVAARKLIQGFTKPLGFKPLQDFMIEERAWHHVQDLRIKPQMVFCHPEVLMAHPATSLYYRGMAGLSIKAAKDYFGSVESMESGTEKARVSGEKALKMARAYNLFLSSIIINSTRWTLDNGHRTILATMGITLDGTMRNKVGDIAEERIRRMIVEWLAEQGLVENATLRAGNIPEVLPREVRLKGNVTMQFSSEPDIAFQQSNELRATVEIKGGIDPAGALERYGAAKKSFEHAVQQSGRCRNFYLGGVFTDELVRRINADRLVEKTYNIVYLLNDAAVRAQFFTELFHFTLRIF